MARRLKYLILLLLGPLAVLAQTKQVKFTEIKGTSNVSLGKINAFAQDNDGFVWMSDQTNRCIIRYDGSEMKRYGFDPEAEVSIQGFYPEVLLPDSNGVLWIGYYGQGFDKFNTYTNEVTHWENDPSDPESISNNFVSSIIKDREGKIWIGHYGGVSVLDEATGSFKHYRHDPNESNSLSNDEVRVIYEDKSGTIWIGCGFPWTNGNIGGLNRFNRQTNDFTRFLHNPQDSTSLAHNKVRAIFEDSRGTFWVGSLGKGGLHTMDRKSGKFTRHYHDSKNPSALSRSPVRNVYDHITFITEDSEKQIWIGTEDNGILRYNAESEKTTHYGRNSVTTNPYDENSGWAIIALDQDLLYVTTQSARIYQIDLKNYQIPHYEEFGQVGAFLHSDDNNLWFGTSTEGLFTRNPGTGRDKNYKNDPSDPNSLSHNNVDFLFEDSKNNVWVSTTNGLGKYNPLQDNFKSFYSDPNDSLTLTSNDLAEIIEDENGNFWIGTFLGGLSKMNPETEEFDRIPWSATDLDIINSGNIAHLLQEDENNLLLGTRSNDGLMRYNISSGQVENFVPGLNVNEIYRDHRGDIWVATTNGLYKINDEGDLVPYKRHQLTQSLSVLVRSIVEDNNNYLWLGTSNGLVRLSPERNQMVLFDQTNGLQGDNQGHLWNGYKDRNGKLYFTSNNGYYSFYPNQFEEVQDPSELLFSSLWIGNNEISINNSDVLQNHISQTASINLAHDKNTFGIEFARVDFRNIGETQIQYQLENYDPTWREAFIGERLSYFRVPPGRYNLRLQSLNTTNGEWAEKSIQIVVAKPWWQEWWAYLMYVILFGLGVWRVHTYQQERTIRQERERIKDRELEQAREIEKAYSELKATQSQLVHAEKMASLGELTAGIAHEIKNPINFVNNFSEVNVELVDELVEALTLRSGSDDFKEELELAHDLKSNQEKVIHHGKRADSIVKNMLQHSRVSSGEKVATDINAIADEYLRLAYHGLRAKDKTFNANMVTDFDPALHDVEVIPQDFGRVLLNLITNAFHACAERAALSLSKGKSHSDNGYSPEVAIITNKSEKGVEVKVRDNGNGIPKSVQDKIFQPFFTTKPTGEGTGLGLSLSYEIITEGHGGRLSFDSTEGEGTTFIINLPDS